MGFSVMEKRAKDVSICSCFSRLWSGVEQFMFVFGNESGQAMTEYITLLVLVALGLSFMMSAFPDAIADYMRALYFCISRPIP